MGRYITEGASSRRRKIDKPRKEDAIFYLLQSRVKAAIFGDEENGVQKLKFLRLNLYTTHSRRYFWGVKLKI